MFDVTAPSLKCGARALLLDRPRIMGVVNVTPDSFSDGGAHATTDSAVAYALRLVENGADLIDVGGESTRPGADPVSVEDEIRRVVPVIEKLVGLTDVPIAVDTSKPEVMRAAVAAGAGLINDVYALRRDGAMDTAAELGVAICLMHMQGDPRTMQDDPQYFDVVGEVHRFLADRALACQFAGIEKNRLLIDPGFGFGKTLDHNLALLRNLEQFTTIGPPVLVGLSRKGMIGAVTGQPLPDRLAGSLAAAVIAVQRGAMIVRAHDVAATRDALAVWQAVHDGDPRGPSRSASADALRRARLFDED
jgi:dihydropteroate synthase